ncbi:MAG: transposase [Cyanobacterium sp. T60_A2020_053]|nr:transposase [Cyanobacterium sp. T60_A2020_053]
MKNKAELSGCQIIDVTEEFTSKTCTKCGHVHSKLGGAKVFKCPECGHRILRDYNGALGIMLKVLSDTTFTISFDGDAIVATGIYRIVPHKCISLLNIIENGRLFKEPFTYITLFDD